MTEADRTQYNFWTVVHGVADALTGFTESTDVRFWPEDLLTTAAACFILADTAWGKWRLGKFEECLLIAHAAQQAMDRFREI